MSVSPVKYNIANGSAQVMQANDAIPSCSSSSSSSKEQVYLNQISRHSYTDGEVSSGSTAGSFTVTNLTRTLDIKFERINYTVKTGLFKKGKIQSTLITAIAFDCNYLDLG